jgi:Fe-S-cluster-containing dehydrogenase component
MKCPVCDGEQVLIKNEFGIVKVILPCADCIGDEMEYMRCPYGHSYYPDDSKILRRSRKTKTRVAR